MIRRPSSRARTAPSHRRRFRPALLGLEDRTLLSVYYNLSTVASTQGGPFTSFGNLVSINDSGTVAFVGNEGSASGLWVNEPGTGLVNVNPSYTTQGGSGRSFLNAVDINNAGELSATDRYNVGNQLFYYTREWSQSHPDTPTDIDTAPGDFDSLQTFTAINDEGDVAYVGLDQDGGVREVEEAPADAAGTTETVAAVPTTDVDANGDETPLASPRPQLTADGGVLVYDPSLTTLSLFDPSDESAQVIASLRQGFAWIGQSPGVSADGRIVVFTGDRGNGPGLFASYASGGDSRTIIRLAGEGVDGFTNFDQLQAVRVNDTESTERGATVVFEGTSNLGTGIYTTRISFFGDAADDFDPGDPNTVTVSGASPVALDGDVMQAASSSAGAVTISSVSLWNGINDENRGEIAFWAQLSDGSQSIIKAEPQQVVYINFQPPATPPPGDTGTNLALLTQMGITSMGWTGDFMHVLSSLGYDASYIGLENDIVAAVQSYYTAVDADVLVLGGFDAQPPAYVPYVVTHANNQPVLDSRGNEVTRGVYQTVYVGAGPENGDTDLGMASPPNPYAGGIDFYNQIPDDTAVVFANRIYNPENTGVPFADLSQATLVEAVATVIAHEAGHDFGLFHLDPTMTQFIMSGGFTTGEFNNPRAFTTEDEPVDADYSESLSDVTESDADRLAFTVGSSVYAAAPPDPALLSIGSGTERAQIGASLYGSSVTVKDLEVAIVEAGDTDLLPVFQDLGSGDLATLLSNANLIANPQDDLIVLGSTTGGVLDIVAAPDSVTATSLSATMLGVSDDSRLLVPLNPAAGASPWHLFQLTSGGAVDLGTLTTSTISPDAPPVAAPIPDQVVTPSTSSIAFEIKVTPEPETSLFDQFSVAPGAPAGASVDIESGRFTFTPESNMPPGTYPVTVDIKDDASSVPTYTSVTFNIIMENTTLGPPAIDPIGNRVVEQGAEATFTVRATDPNGPAYPLTFTLDPGAPAGAMIDPRTGDFSWLPCDAAPGEYPVTIRVTANGTPAFSSTDTVNIQVVAASTPSPGDLVTGFGSGGVLQTTYPVPFSEQNGTNNLTDAGVVLPESDGAFIAGGTAGNYVYLARYLANGDLDTSFGDRGRVTFGFTSNSSFAVQSSSLSGAVLLPDGRIVIAGSAYTNEYNIALARFNADGSVDTSFGVAGSVVVDVGSAGFESFGKAIALQKDGKLIVAGYIEDEAIDAWKSAVVRFLPNGTLDPSFATGGTLIFDNPGSIVDEALGVALQSDGRIDVMGSAELNSAASGLVPEVAMAQLESDGSFDDSFGNGGKLTLSETGTSDVGVSMAVQGDGKILVLDGEGGGESVAVLRLDLDGALDDSFGAAGIASIRGSATASAMALGSNGQIVGAVTQGNPEELFELNPNGSLDASFGTNGQVRLQDTGAPDSESIVMIYALSVEPDGSIITAGRQFGGPGIAVSHFESDGSLDSSFGAGGLAATDVLQPAGLSGAPLMAIEPDGKLLVVPNDAVDGIWQYNADGSVDTSFGDNGVVYLPVARSTLFSGVELEQDGKILLCGGLDGNAGPLVMRLLSDGSLDTSFGDGGFAAVPRDGEAAYVNAPALSVATEADGTIIVSMNAYVAALNADGTVDTAFGTGGVFTLAAGSSTQSGTRAVVLAGGQILVATGLHGLEFYRLDPDGTLDATFGGGGSVQTDWAVDISEPIAMAVEPDGRILVAVVSFANTTGVDQFGVAQFNSDGSADASFGSDGSAATLVADGGSAQAIAIAGDGSILVAGGVKDASGASEFGLVRYTAAGVLDRSFGHDGIVVTDIVSGSADSDSGPDESVSTIALSPNSQTIYVAGAAPFTYVGVASYYDYAPVAAPGAVQFQAQSYTVDQSAGTATIQVTRTGGSSGTVTVHYQTGDDTAQAGINYQATSGTVTWDAGACCASFTVPIVDAGDANSTTVDLTLSDPTGGATLGADDTSILTIIGSGASGSGPGVIQLASATFSASESDESAVIVVDRVGGSSGTVNVPYTVGGGTATAGVDYVPISGTLTFGPGVTQRAVTVPLAYDAAVAKNTTIGITLGQPDGGGALAPVQKSSTLTILDIDGPSVIAPAAGPTQVTANQGLVQVPVTRLGGLGDEVAYNYSTVDGTAIAGLDYTPASGTLVLPPGVATGYIDIPITPNYQLTQPVTFQVHVQAPAGASGPGTTTTQTVEIKPPTPLPAPPTPPPLVPLVIESTSPAAGSILSAVPAQIVVTFNTDLVGLTDGGPAIPIGDFNALSLTIGSTSIAISTVYNELANGTSTITVTPASSPLILTSTIETLSIDLNDYADADGQHVSNPAEGTLRFTVANSGGPIPIPIPIPGQGSPITISPLPTLTAEPGTTLSYPVAAIDIVAGQSLVYRLGPEVPAGASINPLTGLFTWTPTESQAGQTYSILVIVSVSSQPSVENTGVLSVMVTAAAAVAVAPSVTTVTTAQLVKAHKNKGVSTITVTFSQAMADSAGASSFYSVETPEVKRVHHKKVTTLVPVAFTSQRIASNQVKIQLAKPSKLVLQLIIRGTVTNALGVEMGAAVTRPA